MTAPVPSIDLELSPMARQSGVAYVHDVELDSGQRFAVGDAVRLRDEGGALWEAEVTAIEDAPRDLGRKYRLTIRPAAPAVQRAQWRQRASWLSQLGLAADDPVPVAAVEEVANAVLALLDEVRRLELERAEARAWAWSGSHGELNYDWVSLVGTYDGDPDQLPAWLADPRTPDAQDWWPAEPTGTTRPTPADWTSPEHEPN